MKINKTLVAGAGGFIGGHLVNRLIYYNRPVIAIDKKPLNMWYQENPQAENIVLDLSKEEACKAALRGNDIVDVYNLAADMGGMGFIENNRIECLRNIFINANLLEASFEYDVCRYFFSSSACVYNADKQSSPDREGLKETDAYPAMAERGYGWEKLLSEMFCQEYASERGLKTYIARFHNVYGPYGAWNGGREKAPAAICRKVALAKLSGKHEIEIWGDGTRTRSFTYIDDCVDGILKIVHSHRLIATPINLGSSEKVSINQLVDIIENIAGIKLNRTYKLDAPQGVSGRSSDNTFIKSILNWEPSTSLQVGLEKTYEWVENEVRKHGDCYSPSR